MLREDINIKAPITVLALFTFPHLYVLNRKNKTNRKLLGFDYTLSMLKPRKRLICFALIKSKKKYMTTFDPKDVKHLISYVEKFNLNLRFLNFHFINYNMAYSNANIFKIVRYASFFNYIFFSNKQNFNFFFYMLIGAANRLPLPHWYARKRHLSIPARGYNLINLRSDSKIYLFNFNLELI